MPGEQVRPPPFVQAMLLADHIYSDAGTGKRYILGTYSRIMAARFPHAVPRLWLYLVLTGGHGTTLIRVRIVDMDEKHGPLLEATRPINMSDPTDIYSAADAYSVVFPSPGTYRIQVFADNDFLRELCLQVVPRPDILGPPNEP